MDTLGYVVLGYSVIKYMRHFGYAAACLGLGLYYWGLPRI